MKVYIVWMTSLFFYRLNVETTPGKGVTKLGVKKLFLSFVWKWFRKDYKDDPGRNFCWHNIFHPFSGVESWGW